MSKLINIYQTKWTVIPNDALFDKRLDFRARGVLSTIIALPDGWDFSVDGLVKLVCDTERGEGRSAVTSTIQHLEKLGYLERVQTKSANGKFTGFDYRVNIPPITVC